LAGIRRFVGRWHGKLTVRSGTARIGIIPEWDEDVPMTEGLPYFPGAQMQIIIPERVGEAPARPRSSATSTRGRSRF